LGGDPTFGLCEEWSNKSLFDAKESCDMFIKTRHQDNIECLTKFCHGKFNP
jgi:hypothetical protein